MGAGILVIHINVLFQKERCRMNHILKDSLYEKVSGYIHLLCLEKMQCTKKEFSNRLNDRMGKGETIVEDRNRRVFVSGFDKLRRNHLICVLLQSAHDTIKSAVETNNKKGAKPI